MVVLGLIRGDYWVAKEGSFECFVYVLGICYLMYF